MAITGGMLGAAHTTSTADDFVPELWSDGIYRYFERGTIFKNLVEDYYLTRKHKGTLPSAYSYECKTCTVQRIIKRRKINYTIGNFYPDW